MVQIYEFNGRTIDPDQARAALSDPYKRTGAKLVARSAAICGVKEGELRGSGRTYGKRRLAHARFGVMWVLRQAGWSYHQIKNLLGYKDHTSIKYGIEWVENARSLDWNIYAYTNDLLRTAGIELEEAA